MATSSAVHGRVIGHDTPAKPVGAKKHSEVRHFLADLRKCLLHEFTQAEGTEEIDLFRKHMNAMAITYFGIIVVCIIISIPVLAYLVNYNWLR